ncbi:hypothetical protein LZ012_18840 [Dechloromonas sp. XY25]|uniref:EF-hand domain-containing protein n=1 Tax=Dechloromonas hankyongensis TaxID=2908002 RepID=A0ABS9K7K1_9RHOO|nr:hypothetical protein [Dechloromonas hankyongensis]MCG2579054.1 hypothetical protein [Dechloromonas hankyongensis]
MTRQTIATLILLAAVPFAASAADNMGRTTGQSASTQGDMSQFKQLDKNNDGQISQSEAKASPGLSRRFSSVDTDHDKQISTAEWQTDQQQRGAAGVSGETRDQGQMGGQQSPSTPQNSGSESNRTY